VIAPPPAQASRLRRLELLVLLGALQAFAPLSIDMYLPAMPVMEGVFHVSTRAVQVTMVTFLLGYALGQSLYGPITDRFGRKRLFFVTLGVYVLATGATALSTDFATFALFRFMTGAGIGGEYSAINSAIQELIPARYRGRTDLGVNGSFWVGAALGAIGSSLLLQPGRLPPDIGW